ncbi:RagB/SusD family nutrient uptake outer membrane protein [Maribellus maritimus]|uniref:RagB/SusD family nutrient uptake outer membrane protein n=1 Tax=Maribellus maritimus TaxID=2870838 RepID=UPI001EEAFC0E|nr:RagB/SusD family nutrient uptake outer membrane protein [Maribellus maritimus]MCG6188628.1 RagB/SusD family nutrient uptake outer membrane protein [Maribellus maritimus]
MKTKIYKLILLSFLGLWAAATFTRCTDLEETIYDTLAAEKYTFSEKDAASLFSSVYSSFRNVYWGWEGYCDIQCESSDLWCTPLRIEIGWGTHYVSLHKHEFHAGIKHLNTEWINCYSGINACNSLLADEAVRSSEPAVAQLRAYRALYYYVLFDLFRNVPLDTTYNHPDGWLPTQAPPQDTWDFITNELNDIKGKCGEDNKMGKMSDYAVNMLLAKMYINHNAWFNDFSDNSYYGMAIDEVNEVINSGRFSLAPNYKDNFKLDISVNPEIIFGIPMEENYARGNYYANKWIHTAGRAVWDFNGWATGGSTVLPQFLDTYDEDDSRYTDCWTLGQQYDRSGNPIMVEGEPLIYTKEIHSADDPGCYAFEGGRLIKYEILSGDLGTYYDDIPFFRLADAMFIKAECLLRLGGYKGEDQQIAADLVTQVRQRAFKDNPTKAIRTVDQLKGGSVYEYGHRENKGTMGGEDNWIITHEGGDDIELGGLLDDLAWEFVAEHHRRQDLIRFRLTGKNQNVYNGKSWFCKDAKEVETDIHCNIFPIFQEVLDGNSNLVQNPGFSSSASE